MPMPAFAPAERPWEELLLVVLLLLAPLLLLSPLLLLGTGTGAGLLVVEAEVVNVSGVTWNAVALPPNDDDDDAATDRIV